MNRSFPKQFRLLKREDFRSMKADSQRAVGKSLCIDIRPSKAGVSRLGITASGKYGSSCERNRFKRLVREAFRELRTTWPTLELHIVPRQRAKTAKLADILADFHTLVTPYARVKS